MIALLCVVRVRFLRSLVRALCVHVDRQGDDSASLSLESSAMSSSWFFGDCKKGRAALLHEHTGATL